MVILSAISVAAYKCIFHDGFSRTPESYFFHLFYYRSHHCRDSSVNWSLIGIEQTENVTEILQMPIETLITTRNFRLSLAQLVVNCLLVVTSLLALGKLYFKIWKWNNFLNFSYNSLASLLCIEENFLLGSFCSLLPNFAHLDDLGLCWRILLWRW